MNCYPSWIHRIPEMIEALALAPSERIDRRLAERLFGLRRTAAADLLRRLGAEQCGRCWVIGRGLLMARLREMQEHPDFQWEVARRERVERTIEEARRNRSRTVLVSAAEIERLAEVTAAGLPETIRITPGQLHVSFADMEDLLRQLIVLIRAIDNDYAGACRLAEKKPPRKRPGPAARVPSRDQQAG